MRVQDCTVSHSRRELFPRMNAVKACSICAAPIADAATVCRQCNHVAGESRRHDRGGMRRWLTVAAGIAALFVMVLFASAMLTNGATPGAKAAAPLPAVTLTNVVETLPANSWKAIPVLLPHQGRVRVDVEVMRGNAMNVFLVSGDELRAFQADDARAPLPSNGFEAIQAKAFEREGQLASGQYYVLLQDASTPPGGASPSDVAVQVQVRP